MKRANRLLVAIAACAASAWAAAQPGQADPDDAAPVAEPAQENARSADAWLAGRYVDLRRVTPIIGSASAGKAKSELCTACHGADGTSVVPPFPNLGGQGADFLYWQLVEFKRNPGSPMSPLVTDLSDQDMRDLSIYYAGLSPGSAPASAEPAGGVPAQDAALLERGERLYFSGEPAQGIPPCQGCHGVDAGGPANARHADRSGHLPFATWPALRGQQSVYLQTKLAEYRDGKMDDSTTDFVMTGVGKRLDGDSIQALAAWLSSLPPARQGNSGQP